jgi:biotin-dependent carboxylase-like uncharacterized protein
MIQILATGPQSVIQDLGRPGWSHIGVGPSGAFDRAALRLANRLVGNRETTACIETLGGGFRLTVNEPTIVCVTGADGPVSIITNGVERLTARNAPIALGAHEVLGIEAPTSGLRSYVAIRQGLRVESTLGSASTDTLASIGPAVLVAGQKCSLGSDAVAHPPIDLAVARSLAGPLNVIPGPRWDWFTAAAQAAFVRDIWEVSPISSRIGIRLTGTPLERVESSRELASEPMVTGAIQVPPDGLPVTLGPDRPTTGGYPVIAVVVDAHLDRLAQLAPGTSVTFRAVDLG